MLICWLYCNGACANKLSQGIPTLSARANLAMARPKAEELKAHGLSDLHAAIIHGQLGRVREIISDKTHLEETIETPDLDGTTPLMTAVLAGRLEITRFLIQNGASVLVRDLRGRDALAHTKTGPFWEKLRTYKRLGLPSMTRSQHTERQVIAKILQHSMALESWLVGH